MRWSFRIRVFKMIRRCFRHASSCQHADDRDRPRGWSFGRTGASRVVTARELSLEEIRGCMRQVLMRLESFIHGAYVTAVVDSAWWAVSRVGKQSGNRGRCVTACRLPYQTALLRKMADGQRKGKRKNYVLWVWKISTIEILPRFWRLVLLQDRGQSLASWYTAGVTSVYRKYLIFFWEGSWELQGSRGG